jgi:site-specific recombinase XerD
MKVAEALRKFQVQLEADGRSPHTIAQYERHIRLFSHWCDEVSHSGVLSEISHEDVAEFLVSPQAQSRRGGGRKKATTLNALRTSLRCFFQYLHRAGAIPHDPGRLIRRARCGRPQPKILSDKEVDRLLAILAADESYEGRRDHVLFHLMLATGIRLGSVVALDVDDVDLDAGVLRLRTFKGDREEMVYLNDKMSRHMKEFLDGMQPGPLFTTRKGRRITRRQVQRRFSQWIEKAKISWHATVHSARHFFATRLYQKTGDIFVVKAALCHRSIVSTLTYARADEQRLRQALQS